MKNLLIIGLGNPGEKFELTPHNAGFVALNFFVKKNSLGNFTQNKKIESLILETNFDNKKIILVKPQTFMNESGKAVQQIIAEQKDQIEDVIVIHDDIDLPMGKIKVAENRGSAGHKGVESIINAIGNKNLVRIRIGILPPEGKPQNPKNFVIRKLKDSDQTLFGQGFETAANALETLIKEGLEKAMNEYNK